MHPVIDRLGRTLRGYRAKLRVFCRRHTRFATIVLAGLTGAPSLMALAPDEKALHVPQVAVPAVMHVPAVAPKQAVQPVRFRVINASASNADTTLSTQPPLYEAEPNGEEEAGSRIRANKSFRFRPGKGVRFRTWCVRLCDGFYYPINNLTTRDRLAADEMKCQSSCSSESRLYFNTIVGYKARPLTDMQGNLYTSLPTAFAYRTKLDPSCTCGVSGMRASATVQPESASAGGQVSAANASPNVRSERPD
jgi:hypothetical protein